jgi:hypothetical protein
VHQIAADLQYRLHKGMDAIWQMQVGSTLPAGPDAACTAQAELSPAATKINPARFFGAAAEPVSRTR